MLMNLWLDDIRNPRDWDFPRDWIWVKTVEDAKRYLGSIPIKIASLDNDLGCDREQGRRLVLWMAENEIWPEEVRVHSANVVAWEYMRGMIKRYKP
jgi:hypothetical protein